MRKEDRVVFSKYPAPIDKNVQYIFRSYQRFRKNIIKSIENTFRVSDEFHTKDCRPKAKIVVRRNYDGSFSPILTKPIRLNPPDLEKLQTYEQFFVFYRDQKYRLMSICNLWFSTGEYVPQKYPYDADVKLRLKLMNMTVRLMSLGLLDTKLISDIRSVWNRPFLSSGIEQLQGLFENVQISGVSAWSYFNIVDVDGRLSTPWWKHLRKLNEISKPKKLPPAAFVSFSV